MKVIPLAVAGAFHTMLIAVGRRTLAEGTVPTCPMQKPRIPVISQTSTARPHDDFSNEIRELPLQQVAARQVRRGRLDALTCSTNWHHAVLRNRAPSRVLAGLLQGRTSPQ
jgi:hypothetical protein